MKVNRQVTLRSFKKYQPRQIAKFVKGFFNGRIFIAGLGRFRVIEGKLVPYKHANREHKVVIAVSEINKVVSELSRQKTVSI